MQNIFAFIIDPMEMGLIWLANQIGSAGIAIIVFTIFVRLVLAPLNILQLKNAKAMQRVQPHLQDLRKKHGKDKQALSQATMELYREHNVNPAMGCLPTLLQFPILIGLFYALRALGQSPNGYPSHTVFKGTTCNAIHITTMPQWMQHCYTLASTSVSPHHVFDLFHAQFLWLSSGLGSPDPLYILPVLAGVTQWVQSRMMLTRSTDPQQQMMNSMMNFMPLIIVFFALRYASGLPLYWVTSTLIGILIQYRITGLGLLPETLGSIFGRRSGQPTRNRTGTGGSNGRTPGNARALIKNEKKDDQNGASPVEDAHLNGNGSGGDGAGPTATVRPRRKPKGGRGGKGGRRF